MSNRRGAARPKNECGRGGGGGSYHGATEGAEKLLDALYFVTRMRNRACDALEKQKKTLFAGCRSQPPPSRHFPLLKNYRSTSSYHDNGGTAGTRRSSTATRPLSTSPPLPRTCRVYNITGGTIPYDQAWLWQQRLLHERMTWQRTETPRPPAPDDVLLLLEHPPVFTLGRGSSLDHLRFDPTNPSSSCGREVRRTERGGEVTWHGPGQIVGYPVLDLNYHKKDLHWYLRQLEEVSEGGYLAARVPARLRSWCINHSWTHCNGVLVSLCRCLFDGYSSSLVGFTHPLPSLRAGVTVCCWCRCVCK